MQPRRGGLNTGDNEIQPSREKPILAFFAKQLSSMTVVILLIIGIVHLYPNNAISGSNRYFWCALPPPNMAVRPG